MVSHWCLDDFGDEGRKESEHKICRLPRSLDDDLVTGYTGDLPATKLDPRNPLSNLSDRSVLLIREVELTEFDPDREVVIQLTSRSLPFSARRVKSCKYITEPTPQLA